MDGERLRRQEGVIRQRSGSRDDRLDAGHVQGREPAVRLGGRKQGRGIAERGRRHRSNQAFEADDAARVQRDDRLIHRPQLAMRDHLGDRGRRRAGAARRELHGRIEARDLGPSASLRRVHRGVGLRVELCGPQRELRHRRDAARERERSEVLDAERRLEGLREQASRHDLGAREIGVRQEHGELIAAHAECPIRQPERAGEKPAESTQHPIAAGVAAAIVDCLEFVQVDQEECERHVIAERGGDLALELLMERSMVAEAGQGIPQGIGKGGLVALLEVGLRRHHRRHDASECEGGHHDGGRRRDEDGDRVVGDHGQAQAVDGREGEHGEHHGRQQPTGHPAGRGSHARRDRVVGIQRALLRVPPLGSFSGGIAEAG